MNDNKQLLTQFMESIWNKGTIAEIPTYVHEQYHIEHDPRDPWDGQILNHTQFQERLLYSRNAFPDLRFDIQEMVAEENIVATFWIMSGTHLGDLPNMPATGRPFLISGMTFYRFRDGKIAGHTQEQKKMLLMEYRLM